MSNKPIPAYSDKIISLKLYERDSYQVVVEIGKGRTVETVCRIDLIRLRSGKEIRGCRFDSREFELEIMAGNINSRAICRQIGEFHDKLNETARENPTG